MRFVYVATLLLLPVLASAHHSRAEYDSSVVIELEGTVERVQWMNPHLRLTLRVPIEDGKTELWRLESTDVTRLDRAGLPHDLIEVGGIVRVAGDASSRPRRMFVRHLLLPDDTELLLSGDEQWWPEAERVVGSAYPLIEAPDPVVEVVDGLFRVWFPGAINPPPDFVSDPPFTDSARAAYAAYDPVHDDPVLNCTPPGMPRLMTRAGRRPIEFVSEGDKYLIRVEAFALVREIHMTATESFQEQPPRSLGYSVGHWEGSTLVVTTTGIDWPYFDFYDFDGAPQSTETEITEWFTLSEDERELTYDISANDPLTFTEPVTAKGYRIYEWRPGQKLMPYEECGGELIE